MVPQRDPWQECDLKGSRMQPGGGPEWEHAQGRQERSLVCSDMLLADLEAGRRVRVRQLTAPHPAL